LVRLKTSAAVQWHVDTRQLPFEVEPTRGIGPATLRLIPRPAESPVDQTVNVPFVIENASIPPPTLTVRFKSVEAVTGPPFGFLDTPPDPVVASSGPITFQGWVLDGFCLRRVWAEFSYNSGRIVQAGEGVRGAMRPDLAQLHPNAYDIYNDGWSLTVQPSTLHRAPKVVLRFYAENCSGDRREIGRRNLSQAEKEAAER
jgi:hypothetical protein